MEWSYVAGYFDGEGNVNLTQSAHGNSTRMVSWFNTHAESLHAIRAFMGVGRVVSRATNYAAGGYGSKKPAYHLYVSNKADMLHVLDHMLPHLIIKREKALALRTFLIEHVDESRMVNFGKVAAVSTEQLQSWYDGGDSQNVIAARLGVTRSSVLQAMRVRGIKARARGFGKSIPKSAETRARMLASRRAMWADPAFVARQAELRANRKATG